MDPESIKELLASIRKMMGKQRSCSTTDMGCRNMECCFIEGNEVRYCHIYNMLFINGQIWRVLHSRQYQNLTVLVEMLLKHCISLSNQGGFVDDDNEAIVTENDEDLEENEDEASSRELVA